MTPATPFAIVDETGKQAQFAHPWLVPPRANGQALTVGVGRTGFSARESIGQPTTSASRETQVFVFYSTTMSPTMIPQAKQSSLPSDPSLTPALARIADMARLEPNWDAEGANPPAARAIAEACLLVESVSEAQQQRLGRRFAPWTSAPIADGGLQVEWLGRDARIEVQIAPDGSFGYLIQYGVGATAEYEERDGLDSRQALEKIDQILNR